MTATALTSANANACARITTTTAATPNGPAVPSAHHLQRPLRRAVAAQPVGGVGQPVDVQAAGGEQQHRHREHTAQRADRPERAAPPPTAPPPPARRARRPPAAARSARRGPAVGCVRRIGRTVPNAKAPATERITRVDAAGTPASSNVAIDASVATAARTTGSATAAPVPSPSRIRRSTIGSRSSCSQRQRVRRFGGPVARLPPLPGARREPLGHQRRRRHHHAVEQHRGAAHRGLRAEPRHRGQIGAAADPQQRNGIALTRRGPGRARRGSRRSCGPSPRRRCRCPGRPRRPARSRSVRRSEPLRPWCFRCPCRRRSAGPRRSRPPRRRSGGPPRSRPATSSAVSASSTAMLPLPRRTLCAPIDGDSGSSASTAMSATRTRRAGRLGQHVDRRAAGVEVGDHLRGHLRRIRRHTRRGRRRGRRRTPPPAPARTAVAGRRPGTTPPTPTGPPAGPARRAAWSACPDGPRRAGGVGVGRRDGLESRSPHGVLDGHRLAGDHQHHPVAQRGQALVEGAQLVGEPSARLGVRAPRSARPRG